MIPFKHLSYLKKFFPLKCLISLGMFLIILLVFFETGASGQRKEFTAKINKDGIQVIEVKAGDYFYSPNIITIKVNVPVEIRFVRVSEYVTHNIIIKAPEEGMDINKSMPFKSEPTIVKFTPTKTGNYPFYCNRKVFFFFEHRSRGMEGILKVVE